MTKEFNTYTYTARDATNPDKVVTLTLADHKMHVDLAAPMESIYKIRNAEDRKDEITHQVKSKAQPVSMRVAEMISGPVHVDDVSVDLDNGELNLTAWKRLAGLRFAPLMLKVDQVDNIYSAEKFVQELDKRKLESRSPSWLIGPLDYWFGWAALIAGIAALLFVPRIRKRL